MEINIESSIKEYIENYLSIELEVYEKEGKKFLNVSLKFWNSKFAFADAEIDLDEILPKQVSGANHG